MSRHERHHRLRSVHPYQLTLPLLWTRDDVRSSLVVIRGGAAPEPIAPALLVARKKAA